ncbi:hypothetical protein C8A03DRAFT_19041 [Achaetomium macrosporum]|uniref:DUF7896 domain-containing protein n=1 Tax=Achaetomium macrosporum TaxID=79813 RepID=A0AAN7C2S7_9PEZI|nr:hypothetical protein C8A03DRAFT_19041 [Achaetomium macrosporum]
MSQLSEVEQLRALLEKNEREKLELIQQLNRAQTCTIPGLDGASPSHQIPPPPHPPLGDNGCSRASADEGPPPMKRSKTAHDAVSSTTAPMMRSRSNNLSRSGPKPNPFTARGPCPITPPVPRKSLPTATPVILGDYHNFNQNQFQSPMDTAISDGSLLPGHPQFGGLGREIPFEELMSMPDDQLFAPVSPINIGPQPYASASVPSVCGSLTSGPTLDTAPMSRCNSSLNDNASLSGQFSEMVRIQSQQSAQSPVRPDGLRPSPIAAAAYPPLPGTATAMAAGPFSHGYPSSAPVDSVLSQYQHQHPMRPSLSQSSIQSTTSSAGLPSRDLGSSFLNQHLTMERSVSKDSVKSNSSLQHRAKEALARQNHAAKSRHLQPKPAASAAKQESADPANSSANDGKAIITKTKYERPKHPKVMCGLCDDHPDGFRGEHELKRHHDAKHQAKVLKWFCCDPSVPAAEGERRGNDEPITVQIVKPLKDCKQCSQGKYYGAYYNAAAHLRRTHFNVKPRKGAKNGASKADEEKEKRGGIGGGDWPPMDELKKWMRSKVVQVYGDEAGDDTESVGAAEAEEFETGFPDLQYPSQAAAFPTTAMSPDGFDMATAAFANISAGLHSQGIDIPFQGAFDSQPPPSGMYSFPAPPLQGGLPAAASPPSGFDYANAGLSIQQGIGPGVSFDGNGTGNGYTSPVSSSATITDAGVGVYGQQSLLSPAVAMQANHGDVADLPFDLTFTGMGQ